MPDAKKTLTWADIVYFKPEEFDSPGAPGSGVNMNLDFVKLLDELRAAVGHALAIDSGYRTPEHNATLKDAVSDSAHTRGLAADIRAISSSDRFLVVRVALQLGFRRLGVGRSFVHLDVDVSKDQDVIWLY